MNSFLRYKWDQWHSYFKNRVSLARYLASNFSRSGRKQLNNEFRNRGLVAATESGIQVPDSVRPEDLVEVFYSHIYDVPGFIPGQEDHIVDVGASIGDWAVYCAKIHPPMNIVAFEPLPDRIEVAREFAKLNHCEQKIDFMNFALSRSAGRVTTHVSGNMANAMSTGRALEVEQRTLDSFRLECSILKIDVEGYEVDVLEGGIETIRAHHPRIILETHSKILHQKCKDILEREGYRLVHHDVSRKCRELGFDRVQNVFFAPK
jgi:FkbM family methyltransferase